MMGGMSSDKSEVAPPPAWFEMAEVRRRNPATSVWIVLKQSEATNLSSSEESVDDIGEYSGVDSVAVPIAQRAEAEALEWSDLGGHITAPHAFEDGRYKTADQYLGRDERPLAISLVLREQVNSAHIAQWLLHQDLVLALRLVREGDVWLACDEGYVDVARLKRNHEGRPIRLEIRAEFLRDYLAARGMVLRASQYFQRWAIVQDASAYSWAKDGRQETTKDSDFELRAFPLDAKGLVPGKAAVFKMFRTDVDEQGDVPEFGPEHGGNTSGTSAYFDAQPAAAVRVEGELWRNYWIEPAGRSERVRGDANPEDIYYFTGAAGERTRAADLNHEDIGRWLWFRPGVVPELLKHRGASLEWYTRETGGVSAGPGQLVHFGLNALGLVTVYAFDVTRLPRWEQRIWAGYNIAPDGGVSEELMSAQMACKVASTHAPERSFRELVERINVHFSSRFGGPLFKPHPSTTEIMASVHRFRAHDQASMLALAKDVARLTADSIDVGVLRQIVGQGKGETPWRSLRHLQEALAKLCGDPVRARAALTPLAGIYDLRLADAHLPSKALEEALPLVPIDSGASPMQKGTQLLDGAVHSLESIFAIAVGR